MKTLDEAIAHCRTAAAEKRDEAEHGGLPVRDTCLKCAEEHEQLAEWLEDYRNIISVYSRTAEAKQARRALPTAQLDIMNRARIYMSGHSDLDYRAAFSFSLTLAEHADGLLPILEGFSQERKDLNFTMDIREVNKIYDRNFGREGNNEN